MANDTLTLVIESTGDSEHVSLDDFVAQLDALRTALERTDAALNGGQQTIEWEVTGLSHSSPATIELRARPRRRPTMPKVPADEVIRAFGGTVRSLNESQPPASQLDYSAVNSYRSLGGPVSAGRVTAVISTPYETVSISPAVEATATKVLDEDVVTDGSYKGLLEFLNIHGRKNEFRIYPPAGPNYVTCEFDQTQLDSAKRAVGHSVRVHGKVVYKARTAFPYRIEVTRIQVLPSDNELPSLMSLRGVAPEATGSLSSEDFVRSLRDAS
jgi:hypothetical protein